MGTQGFAEYWRDDDRGMEAMHARFREHVYTPHTHETYSFGVTDLGAQQFHCRGALHTSSAGLVMALNPDEVHDGRAAGDLGYHYRIVHIHPRAVRAVLADAAGQDSDGYGPTGSDAPLPLFTRPVLGDSYLADAIARLHGSLSDASSRLARDERLSAVILGASARAGTRGPRVRALPDSAGRRAARRARALMREAYPETVPVDLLAQAAGCSRFALYRAFRAEFGMSPSGYERELRLRDARARLAAGGSAAGAAAAAGFADQAHLSRWFKRAYGITPGEFARAGR